MTLNLCLWRITRAAEGINLLEFIDPDQRALPHYSPGAHLDIDIADCVRRQYSLVRPYRSDRGYVIAVKRELESRGGSRYLHEKARVGQRFQVEGPRNNFPLVEDAQHVVLIAGGIGVAPIWCMAARLQEVGRSFELHYAARRRAEAAFLDDMRTLSIPVATHFDEEQGHVLELERIVGEAPTDSHFYCCGPIPMIQAFERVTAEIARTHVHVEYFASAEPIEHAGGFVVELARSGLELKVAPGHSILETIRAAGLTVPASCEEGLCGACETRVLAGEPDHRDLILSAAEKSRGKTIMICCSGSRSPRLVLDL